MAGRRVLIAGAGQMVPLLVTALRARAEPLRIICLTDRRDLDWPDIEHIPLREAGRLIASLRTYKPTEMTLAGGVSISDAEREGLARAFGLAGRFARSLGDLGLAGLIWFEARRLGIRLVGAHEVLPELIAPAGQIAGPPVDPAHMDAVRRALRTARQVGRADLGQAVVTSLRRPIAAEDAGGTDGLLDRVAMLRDAGLAGGAGQKLILAKALKPRQPKFVDLPSIGPDTIDKAAAAGITIVAVEAGQSLVIERERLAAVAAAKGVSVLGVTHG